MNDDSPRRIPLGPVSRDGTEIVARFFRTLGDLGRLQLLALLLEEEHTVTGCVAKLGMARKRVATQLSCLVDCGFVEMCGEGPFARYRVVDPEVVQLVELAQELVEDSATTLDGRLRIGPQD